MKFICDVNGVRRRFKITAMVLLCLLILTSTYMLKIGLSIGSIIVSATIAITIGIVIFKKNIDKLMSMEIILKENTFIFSMGEVTKEYHYSYINNLELIEKRFDSYILRFNYENDLQEIRNVYNIKQLHIELLSCLGKNTHNSNETRAIPIEFVKYLTYAIAIITLLSVIAGYTSITFHLIIYLAMIYNLSIKKYLSRSNYMTRKKEVVFCYVLISAYIIQLIAQYIEKMA